MFYMYTHDHMRPTHQAVFVHVASSPPLALPQCFFNFKNQTSCYTDGPNYYREFGEIGYYREFGEISRRPGEFQRKTRGISGILMGFVYAKSSRCIFIKVIIDVPPTHPSRRNAMGAYQQLGQAPFLRCPPSVYHHPTFHASGRARSMMVCWQLLMQPMAESIMHCACAARPRFSGSLTLASHSLRTPSALTCSSLSSPFN